MKKPKKSDSKSTAPKLSEKDAQELFRSTVTDLKALKEKVSTAEVLAGAESGHKVLSYVEKTGVGITQTVKHFAAEIGPDSKKLSATLFRYASVARTFRMPTVKELLKAQKPEHPPLTVAMLYECGQTAKGDEKAALAALKKAQEKGYSADKVRELRKMKNGKTKKAKKKPAEEEISDPQHAFIHLMAQLEEIAPRYETFLGTIPPERSTDTASKMGHSGQAKLDSVMSRLDAMRTAKRDAKRMVPIAEVEDPTPVEPSLAPPTAAPPLMLPAGR